MLSCMAFKVNCMAFCIALEVYLVTYGHTLLCQIKPRRVIDNIVYDMNEYVWSARIRRIPVFLYNENTQAKNSMINLLFLVVEMLECIVGQHPNLL